MNSTGSEFSLSPSSAVACPARRRVAAADEENPGFPRSIQLLGLPPPILPMETTRLPFSIDSAWTVLRIDGIVIAGPEHLILEYRTIDNVIGAFAGNIKARTIAWTELERAEC